MIASAMVSVATFVLGVVATIFIQSYFRKLSDESSLLTDLIGDVAKIEDHACRYWACGIATSAGGLSLEEDAVLAAKVRGAIHATGSFMVHGEKLLKKNFGEFRRLDGDLYDAATGGDFETADRSADPQRIVAIMAVCNEMRTLLRSSRWLKLFAH